ncbi:hypothetical protein ACFLQR_02775 [Verrucomicrobiota bacterium]
MTRTNKCGGLPGSCKANKPDADNAPDSAASKMVSDKAIAAAKEMGLCATCDNRETCTFPNAGKNIHLCEEYE